VATPDVPPPPPPVPIVLEGEPIELVPRSMARWYGKRSLYADELKAYTIDLQAELRLERDVSRGLRLEAASNLELAKHWEAVAKREQSRPGWGAVAGVGIGTALAGFAAGVVIMAR